MRTQVTISKKGKVKSISAGDGENLKIRVSMPGIKHTPINIRVWNDGKTIIISMNKVDVYAAIVEDGGNFVETYLPVNIPSQLNTHMDRNVHEYDYDWEE